MEYKILFLIPVYDDNPDLLIANINQQFPQSLIILVDDGYKVKSMVKNVVVIRNEGNIGLAKSLAKGYRESLVYEYDYLVRIDPDEEYPLEAVQRILYSEKNSKVEVAICGYTRTLKSNGLIDTVFNRIFGFLEGIILLGQPLPQHSPALLILSRRFLVRTVDQLSIFSSQVGKRWGLDLDVLTLVTKDDSVLVLNYSNDTWVERRDVKKIFAQAQESIAVLGKHIMNRRFKNKSKSTYNDET